jgi:hypothetical protein
MGPKTLCELCVLSGEILLSVFVRGKRFLVAKTLQIRPRRRCQKNHPQWIQGI